MDLPSTLLDFHSVASGPHKTICIIGAGPAGLAAIKIILGSEQYKSGKWIPVAFESREDIGGVWLSAPPGSADPPLTPLYDCLTTNLPHPIMAYTSYSFPPGTSLFPPASTVHQYLKDYASHFSLRSHIKFNTTVTSVTQSPTQSPRRWLVQTSDNHSYFFDLVIVCNGHYRVPRYPPLSGLSAWLDTHKASHSAYYRHPLPIYKGKTLLIVGAGPSGRDLTNDLQHWARKIIFSGTKTPNTIDSDGIIHRAHISSFGDPQTGYVTYSDGNTDQGIDYCILATGYCLSFPFLRPPLLHNTPPPPIPPLPKDLYNSSYSLFPLAQHIWPLQSSFSAASMAFLGLLARVAPFPLIEAQMRAVLKAFDVLEGGMEGGGIDEQAEAVDIVTRWEVLRAAFGEGNVIKQWHRFEPMEQFDYRDRLSAFAETESQDQVAEKSSPQQLLDNDPRDGKSRKKVIRVQDWEREIYGKKIILRKAWVLLEKSGEAEAWVKGVGEGGISEWVDLMRRVVKYGEDAEEGKAML